jgi:CBS domain-containing protein
MTTTVKSILQQKGAQVWYVSPDTTLLQALQQMAEKNVGALVVLDEDKKLVGILSERDYARRGILQGRGPDTPVREMMTTQVYYVTKEQTIDDCMSVMTDRKIRHLPVVEDGQVVGIVSIGDVVNCVIADQEHLIKGLENYITGTRA